MLLGLYGASALGITSKMTSLLGDWQASPESTDAITALLEHAHRLRGDSTTVELYSTVELLRGFEALLRALRSGELAPTPERCALLEATVDQVADVAAGALEGETEDPASHKDLIGRLASAVRAS